MLSSQEQRIWDDVQLFWAEEAEEPPLPDIGPAGRSGAVARDDMDPPVLVVAGAFSIVLLLLFGEARAALGISVATALGWTLWHYREYLVAWWERTVATDAADRRWDDT